VDWNDVSRVKRYLLVQSILAGATGLTMLVAGVVLVIAYLGLRYTTNISDVKISVFGIGVCCVVLGGLFTGLSWVALRDRRHLRAAALLDSSGRAECAECKGLFPIESLIAHGNVYVCARCKPIFLQKLTEGLQPK
jgi:hypothetical protein